MKGILPKMKASDKTRSFLKSALVLVLIAWASISLARAVLQTFSAQGGNDLYTYWYAGHFLREGKDYYRTFLDGELPAVPVRYLDRQVADLDEVLFPGLVPAPASTAPVFFLLLPLACLSWNVAKVVWLLLNLALLASIPGLVIRLFGAPGWIGRREAWALAAVLVGLTSTRYAAASGQLTFLFLALMLASARLAGSRPWLAGILLGMALSKYSLSAGLLLLFLFLEARPRLVLSAGLVQLAGLAGLSLLSGTGIFTILQEYLQMATWHADMEGVHLAAALRLQGWPSLLVSLALTALVGSLLAVWRVRNGPKRFFSPLPLLARSHLVTVLILWALLAGYHRAYDVMVLVVFFGLLLRLARCPQGWQLSRPARTGMLGFGVLAALLLSVPSGSLVRSLLPSGLQEVWGQAAGWTATSVICIALAVSTWMLFRLDPQEDPPAAC